MKKLPLGMQDFRQIVTGFLPCATSLKGKRNGSLKGIVRAEKGAGEDLRRERIGTMGKVRCCPVPRVYRIEIDPEKRNLKAYSLELERS
ncbi:MAG: hypothetical protein LBT13_01170 [Treponema sp.]|jgi:hypothetical protein|nr:hypothetical protein [Treponema sp.]